MLPPATPSESGVALPWPEKIRIGEQMRAAAREIQSAEESALILREDPPPYGGKKKT